MTDNILEVDNLSFRYTGADEPTLRNVNLNIRKGEITLLIGPTGAGKSTLYLCLNGLIPNLIRGHFTGTVLLAELNTAEHSVPELAQKVGIVFQDPEVQLFSLTVEDELAFGPENLGLPRETILQRMKDAATTVHLTHLLEREPARLSGGQQQTVAIGSVWSMLPDVLIMDEPTSNLDPEGGLHVLSLIQKLNRDYGKTILIAEHKIDEVAHLADHVLVMSAGKIVMDGTPREVFSQLDELHALGLVGPIAAELAYKLRQQGVAWDGPLPLTMDEGVDLFSQ